MTCFVHEFEVLRTLLFATGFVGLVEVVHVFLVVGNILVAFPQQIGERFVGPGLVSHRNDYIILKSILPIDITFQP